MNSRKQPLFLLVEDNPADIALIHEVLGEFDLDHECVTTGDGLQALEYLLNKANRLPDFILLDLNLPKMDGRELLRKIRETESLAHLPVIVHSTSGTYTDVNAAYKMHANSFVRKAPTLDGFRENIRSLVHYWLQTVTLPIQKQSK